MWDTIGQPADDLVIATLLAVVAATATPGLGD
jgi:hypothetical protein